MRDYLYLGPVPSEEKCEQVGPECNYGRMHAECRAFKAQMIRYHPVPEALQAFCGYTIKNDSHDFGQYFELVAWYESGTEAAAEWAYMAEVRASTEEFGRVWDDQSRAELGLEVAA